MNALDLKAIFYKELDAIYGKEEVVSFFFLCTEYYLDLPRFQFTLQPEFTLDKTETDAFFKVIEALKQQKPIQYILGETEFYGLPFKVDNNVLIPRQETEELVDLILQNLKKINSVTSNGVNKCLRILDIGTGSGCIAISLAKHLPNAEVYAVDISKEALKIAKQNAESNAVNINFIEADILAHAENSSLCEDAAWPQMGFLFDVIVSNPPYVRELEKAEIQPNVLDYEPHLALFVKDQNPLVFYKAICNFAINNLSLHGQLYFEINQYLGAETKMLLETANFEDIKLIKDLNGNYRILKGTKNQNTLLR